MAVIRLLKLRVTTRYHTRYHELIVFYGFSITKTTRYHALPHVTIGVP